jgi:hypothetical protein
VTKFLLLIVTAGCLWQCNSPDKSANIHLLSLRGEIVRYAELPQARVQVFFFFGPECPLSENYTAHANKLAAVYGQDSVRFTAIIPGNYDDSAKVAAFVQRFLLRIPVYRDTSWQLTRELGATITPEVFVLADNQLLYHGAIDNWAVSLGTKRRKATEHYLENVLTTYFTGRWQTLSHIPAVGCFIEPPAL